MSFRSGKTPKKSSRKQHKHNMPYDSRSSQRSRADTDRQRQIAAEFAQEKRKVRMEKRRLEIHEIRIGMNLPRIPRNFAFYTRPISNLQFNN